MIMLVFIYANHLTFKSPLYFFVLDKILCFTMNHIDLFSTVFKYIISLILFIVLKYILLTKIDGCHYEWNVTEVHQN